MRNNKFTRRSLLTSAIVAVGVVPSFALVGEAFGAAATPLDPADPAAKALGYVETSAKPDQKCANCAQFQGAATDKRAACAIFPGKSVSAGGWCSVWTKKA
jgi:hypothetical protein